MTPRSFVAALSEIGLDGVFNPYKNRCEVHDLANAPALRRKNLRTYLSAIERLGVDTIWLGRDLGYRGGRRTGLALTDEQRLTNVAHSYPGATPNKATKGPVIAERTAAEIWAILGRLNQLPFLWNVFPFHPYESGQPLSNRKFTAKELAVVADLNDALFSWLGIRRIICIGQDATNYGKAFGIKTECVRHPSYGGVVEFRKGMQRIYGDDLDPVAIASQPVLF